MIYNTYVRPLPNIPVVDYRTETTGITAQHLSSSMSTFHLWAVAFVDTLVDAALPFQTVQHTINQWVQGRILVGHKVWLIFVMRPTC